MCVEPEWKSIEQTEQAQMSKDSRMGFHLLLSLKHVHTLTHFSDLWEKRQKKINGDGDGEECMASVVEKHLFGPQHRLL